MASAKRGKTTRASKEPRKTPRTTKASKGSKARKPGKPSKASKPGTLPAGADVVSLAGRVVDRALHLGADDAEAFVLRGSGYAVGLEGDAVDSASLGEDAGVGVRLVKARAIGFCFFTDEEAGDAALRGALESLAVLPKREFAFPKRAAMPSVPRIHDRRVAGWGPEDGVEACRAMMAAAKGAARGATLAGGGVGWGETELAIANSEGVRASWRGTEVGASVHVVLRDGATSTGFDYGVSRRLDVDWEAVGKGAAALAKAGRRPRKASEGVQTVVFRPTALEGLFETLVTGALMGEAARGKRSVFADKVGQAVMPKGVGLYEDGLVPGGQNSAPFDDEGVPARSLALVEKGILKGYLDDVAGAMASGGRPSSSAMRAGRMDSERSWQAPPRATGRNLVLRGRGVPLEDLVADVERGVVVHDALGAHTANPASGDFSVNAGTLFVVEGGEVVGAGKPVMLGGNLPRALASARLGDDPRALQGSFSPVAMTLPTVRLEGIRVTP